MQTRFAKDNNPNAQTLQKLAEMTGLSRRVIQVKQVFLTREEMLLWDSIISNMLTDLRSWVRRIMSLSGEVF